VPALGNKQVRFVIDTISPRGDYATWRATRQSSGYDVRTFEVRARPQSPVEGLRPGMSVLVAPR
jgi:HlyD family secretion protein